jgi:hypothetical protein
MRSDDQELGQHFKPARNKEDESGNLENPTAIWTTAAYCFNCFNSLFREMVLPLALPGEYSTPMYWLLLINTVS